MFKYKPLARAKTSGKYLHRDKVKNSKAIKILCTIFEYVKFLQNR